MIFLDIMIRKADIANYAKQIVEYSNEFNDEIRKFDALIDEINTIWDGADALKYINVMKEKYIIGLEEMKKIIDEYGEYLKKIPDLYSSVDEIFSSKSIDV